jgi:hypothetical protein
VRIETAFCDAPEPIVRSIAHLAVRISKTDGGGTVAFAYLCRLRGGPCRCRPRLWREQQVRRLDSCKTRIRARVGIGAGHCFMTVSVSVTAVSDVHAAVACSPVSSPGHRCSSRPRNVTASKRAGHQSGADLLSFGRLGAQPVWRAPPSRPSASYDSARAAAWASSMAWSET